MSPVFVVLAALTVAGSIAAMTLRNLVHCALAVAVAFAGLAMLFLQLGAEFVGFVQVLVYVGAVAILVVFAILLTRASEDSKAGAVFSRTWLSGLVIAAAVFAALGWAVLRSVQGLARGAEQPEVTVQQIGEALMSRFVLPLEIVALLLTAALVGAVIVAMYEREGAR